MHANDSQHSSTKLKIGKIAIFIGFVLICIGTLRVMLLPNDAANQAKSASEMVGKAPADINLVDIPTSLDKEPQQIKEPFEINNEALIESEADGLNENNSSTESMNSKEIGSINIKTNVIPIYYAEILNTDGSSQTIQLNAISEAKAREIIRDFRGNPEILQGPSTQPSWQVK